MFMEQYESGIFVCFHFSPWFMI